MACELRYSSYGIAALLVAVMVTIAVIFAVPMPGLLRASLILYVGASSARACGRLLAPRGLRLELSRAMHVRDSTGWISGEVRDGSFVMPWLTIIRWRPEGRCADRTLMLLPDMACAEDLRKIRVFLRWA